MYGLLAFQCASILGIRAHYIVYWMPIQVTSHFYWEKDPLINTELYPTPLQNINYSSALLLSVPIILCKKPFMSQPFVNRLATMGRRWAWYEKCRTGKGIQQWYL